MEEKGREKKKRERKARKEKGKENFHKQPVLGCQTIKQYFNDRSYGSLT